MNAADLDLAVLGNCAIAALVDLTACYAAVRRNPPRALGTMLNLLVPPLLALTHADGSLGNWQGAGAVPAERIEALVKASGVRTRPLRDARQWGYQRIATRIGPPGGSSPVVSTYIGFCTE